MSSSAEAVSQESRMTGGRVAIVVTALILGVISFQLGSSMLSPALPNIAQSLDVSLGAVSQVTSLFFLAGSIAGVVLARWSDFIGRRRMFLAILVVLAVGTVVCIVAPNLPVLVIGRVLQGVSSASFPLAYMILNENLSGKTFGTAMGVVTAVNGGVGGVDAYAGGLLADSFGYQSIFVVMLAVGLIGLVAIKMIVPRDGASHSSGTMDWWGAVTFSIGLIFLTYFISEGSAQGWLAPLTLLYLALTIVGFIAFWLVEKRVTSPLVAVHHLASRQVWPLVATTLLTLGSVFAVLNFTLVVWTQNESAGFGMTAGTSALIVLTVPALIGVVAAPIAGRLAGRFGWLRFLRTGLGLCIIGIAAVALFPDALAAVVFAVVLFGIAYYGLTLTTLNALGVLLSPKEEPGILPGVNGAAFGLGASLGVAVVSPTVGPGTHSGFVTGLIISGALTVLALCTTFLIRPPADQQL